ncbi:MAG: 4Fe-4S dicluster domain-containing protein [Deltaproteobacteria bacterium]|nr:4Fe-4S dicluster domain-containing protein [Deltaproteobacteria bacterium]
MEFTPPLSNLRTQLCVVMTGFAPNIGRDEVWPDAAEEFLRRMNRMGVQITVIGPRPPHKFGTKRTVRFMDRHEVVGMKILAASKSHRLEFRVLNAKTRSWTRLRAEACVTIGTTGVWPSTYGGWTLPGTLSIDALSRWVTEQKWVPGRELIFHGSTNQVLRWASHLLDRGAKNCFVVEEGAELKCWRAYRDRFLAKGGRIFLKHQIQRVEQEAANALAMYLSNEQGTLILNADTVVLAPSNDDMLNGPAQWKKGLFYVQRRSSPWELVADEEQWLERLDWRELYWRVSRALEIADYAECDGALRMLRAERRDLQAYRKPGARAELGYSGKILNRETLTTVQTSVSVPRSFAAAKPVASLECLERVPCRACVDACPENAIELVKLTDLPKLLEDKCTGCGACVAVCPAGAAVMIRELPQAQKARYFLPDDSKELWREGRQLQLLNRKGDVLGTGRVASSTAYEAGGHRVLEIESTNVHIWEARQFRPMKGEFLANDLEDSKQSPVLLKRGWVTLNGVRRLCPVGVPVTVALWQLGQRRFEDALFCHDASCRMCEITVDDRPALACRVLARDGQQISYERGSAGAPPASKNPLCPCKNVDKKECDVLLAEGVSEELMREATGLGHGVCHGRWCLSSKEKAAEHSNRPVFHGYETSPWRDIWAIDVVEEDDAGSVKAGDEES